MRARTTDLDADSKGHFPSKNPAGAEGRDEEHGEVLKTCEGELPGVGAQALVNPCSLAKEEKEAFESALTGWRPSLLGWRPLLLIPRLPIEWEWRVDTFS